MATLKFTSLECIRRYDAVGSDEPRIVVGSDVAWSGVMNKNETEALDGGRSDEYTFSGYLDVRLQEISNGNARQIGQTHRVDNDQTNNGKAVFKTPGTHYELEYRVV